MRELTKKNVEGTPRLLSIKEYVDNELCIPKIEEGWWWLSSNTEGTAGGVDKYGVLYNISQTDLDDSEGGLRPVLPLKYGSNLKMNEKSLYDGIAWVVFDITPKRILAISEGVITHIAYDKVLNWLKMC